MVDSDGAIGVSGSGTVVAKMLGPPGAARGCALPNPKLLLGRTVVADVLLDTDEREVLLMKVPVGGIRSDKLPDGRGFFPSRDEPVGSSAPSDAFVESAS